MLFVYPTPVFAAALNVQLRVEKFMFTSVSPRRLVRGFFTVIVSLGIYGPTIAADPIKEVGNLASEWVKIRAETVRIENDWQNDRKLLSSTLTGLNERVSKLQDRRDHLLAATVDERAELATLSHKLADSRTNLKEAETRLGALAANIIRLRPFLPPRLSTALEMSYRSLDSAELSPGEKMQRVVTVLNRCTQFNLTITQGEDVLLLEGEAGPKAFDVIYWGLSHAYALDRAGGKAWVGSPGPAHWQWEALPGAAPSVAELMAIHLDQSDPRLVSIPARLKSTTGARP